ncbi:MAG: hypothetical protein ACRYF8_12035 [Janthinobacterium lividum]
MVNIFGGSLESAKVILLDPAFVEDRSAFWRATLEYPLRRLGVDRDRLGVDISLTKHPCQPVGLSAACTANAVTVLQALQQRCGAPGAARRLEVAARHAHHGLADSEVILDLSPIA